MLHTNKALVRGERRAAISRACSGVAGGAGVFAEARDHADLGGDDESRRGHQTSRAIGHRADIEHVTIDEEGGRA